MTYLRQYYHRLHLDISVGLTSSRDASVIMTYLRCLCDYDLLKMPLWLWLT